MKRYLAFITIVLVTVAATLLALIGFVGDKPIARDVKPRPNGSLAFGGGALEQTFRADLSRLSAIRIETVPAALPAGRTLTLTLYEAGGRGEQARGRQIRLEHLSFSANPRGETWHEFTFDKVPLTIGREYLVDLRLTDPKQGPVSWATGPDRTIYFGHGYRLGQRLPNDFMLQPVYAVSIANMSAGLWQERATRLRPLLPGSVGLISLAVWLIIIGCVLAAADTDQ